MDNRMRLMTRSFQLFSALCVLTVLLIIIFNYKHGKSNGIDEAIIPPSFCSVCFGGSTDNNFTDKHAPDVKLILVGYMRGGTTFSGDVFNHHPNIFYFYEPLWAIDFVFQRAGKRANFFNRPPLERQPNSSTQISFLTANVLDSIFNCRFKSMYLGPLISPANELLDRSVTTDPYYDCTKKKTEIGYFHRLLFCLPLLENACNAAKVKFVKTVRLPIKKAITFLEKDPSVKIIHLVRDPRGILLSRRRAGMDKTYNQTIESFCNYLTRDFKDSFELKSLFPARVLTARYEDIARSPFEFMAQMLHFVGMNMTPTLRSYVWTITSSHTKFKLETSTKRSDSRKTASEWRKDIDFSTVEEVNKQCREMFRLAGYFPLPDIKTLRNLSVSHYEKDYKKLPLGLWDV